METTQPNLLELSLDVKVEENLLWYYDFIC